MIATAVSAYLDVVEISSRFIRGVASDKALQRLGLARSELRRSLRALGVVSVDAEPDESATVATDTTASQPPKNATPAQLRVWSAGYVQGRGAAAGVDGSAQEPQAAAEKPLT